MLDIESITAGYAEHSIVSEVSLSVSSGEIVLLLGPNAAGKSTLVRAIMGEIGLLAGNVALDASSLVHLRTFERVRRGIGYLPQGAGFLHEFTVEENLSLVGQRISPTNALACELASYLKPHLRVRAGLLSGGYKRILGLAMAVAHDPRLLVLDEPTAGLAVDVRTRIWPHVRRYITEHSAGALVIEHNIDEVIPVADRFYEVIGGKIVRQGAACEFQSPTLRVEGKSDRGRDGGE